MTEDKIPYTGNFGVAAGKDFFGDAGPNLPRKIEIPHKPAATILPKNTGESANVAIVPKPAALSKSGEESFNKKLPPENHKKPFENISEGLVPLRTYREDVAGVMRDKRTSLVQLVLQEQRERNKREREKSPTSGKNLPLILLSATFFFSAVGLVYYIFFRLNPDDRVLENLQITPLIFVEKNKEISTEGKESLAITREIANLLHVEDLPVDVVEYLFFTKTLSVKTADGATVQQKNLIPANRFFETLEIKMPPMLLRALRPDFMFGFHSFNKNQPFFILKTDYYANAFAGALSWENKMAEDILPLFGRADRVRELSQRKWDDTIIKNKDTRVLRNFDGSIALVYVFKDQRTLIITTNEDTLLEVSRRLDLAQEKRE